MIKREKYLALLRKVQDQKVIKVITGVRRAGKSTILMEFREDLAERGVKKAQIQSFNFEEEKNADLLDWRTLHQHIEAKLVPDAMNYIFLDEIQQVEHFERAVDSLFVKENVDLYITGSNARMLSGELATLLTGRYISIHMLPFSFAEYVENFDANQSRDELFKQYLGSSSFPETVQLAKIDQEVARTYLKDVYDTILKKDIFARYDIRNEGAFDRVVRFVMDSIGSPISPSSIAKMLNAQGMTVSNKTVAQFLDYLAGSYLMYPVARYDVRGRKILLVNDKYYTVDLGFFNLLKRGSLTTDLGHRLENAVFLELLRRNEGQVYIGKSDEQEIDFMVQKYDGTLSYYQVAYHIGDDADVLEREVTPLLKVRDNYPKYIITMDAGREDIAGVQKINAVEWFLGDK